jgi:hypothetical protein
MKLKITIRFAILFSLFIFFLLIPHTVLAQTATVLTLAVTDITTTTATGNGNIFFLGEANPTAHGVCWNTGGEAPTTADDFTDEGTASATGAFTSSMTGLLPNITYNVRAYATNTAGTSYGNQVSFTTSPQMATVTTQAVTGITTTSATGNGNITDLGAPNPTAHGVCWNTGGEAPTTADSSTNLGAAPATGVFTAAINGLSPNITYNVRAYATNGGGTSYGNQVSFITDPQAPEVSTLSVIKIGTTTATGRGDFDVLGAPDPTAHGVCWSTIPFSTLDDSIAFTDNGATASDSVFTSNIIGLTPDKLYYIRAYATNDVDTVYGDQLTFTTLPKAPVVTTQAVSDITRDDAIGHGTITDRGIPALEEHGICWSRAPTIPTRSNNDGITMLGPDIGPVPYSFEYFSPI